MGATYWWVEGGDERCSFCWQRYAFEVEVRCADCDAPMCPRCALQLRARRVTLCHPCGAGMEAA